MFSLNSFCSACTKQTPCQNKHTLENRTVYCKSTFWVHVLRPKIRWRRFSWAQGHVERNSISANIRIPCGTRPRDLRFAKLCLFFAIRHSPFAIPHSLFPIPYFPIPSFSNSLLYCRLSEIFNDLTQLCPLTKWRKSFSWVLMHCK